MNDDPNLPRDPDRRTALVTGATSGLGLEAAAQLAGAGFTRVVVTGRSPQRAAQAAADLAERTGTAVFEPLALDLDDGSSVNRATEDLAVGGESIDVLLLNAGMVPGKDQRRTDEGIEVTHSSSLVGHHRLTSGLLAAGRIAPGARIIIAGSEAARGDVPMMHPTDLPSLADGHFGGDRVGAATALITGEAPVRYSNTDTYATAKRFVAWWAAALAPRLAEGTTVNAVSPGSAPYTNADRNGGFVMRRVMLPLMKFAPRRLGMAADTATAAGRYLEAAGFDDSITGQFLASAPGKMTGPLHRVDQSEFHDTESAAAVWRAVVGLTGADVAGPSGARSTEPAQGD